MLSITITHAFPGLSLKAQFDAPNGVTALFGRSGSGKTTLVNAVAGLLRPDHARITLEGDVLVDTAANIFVPPHRRRIGYVFQEARLFPHLTVQQNLRYGRFFAPRGNRADFDQIVDLLGLAPLLARRPIGLSGGEKQRVALGRAILSQPRLLLLDEPLAALDEPRKAEILPYLERLRDDLRLPMLYVSHSAAEVARLATTLVLIDAGRVTAAGPAADLLSDPNIAPEFGVREAGAILTAKVIAHEADGLTRLDCAAGPLWLPRVDLPPGARLRLRILAQDVMLALHRPDAISALNILPATVKDLRLGDGAGAMVQLDAGGDLVLARVTRRSVENLRLAPGVAVHLVLKAVSVAPQSIGGENQP